MPSTSQNKFLTIPTVNGDSNSWGTELNATVAFLDSILGAPITITIASTLQAVTQAQLQVLSWNLSGTLTANSVLQIPTTVGGFFMIRTTNLTMGAYTLTVNTSAVGSTGVSVPANSNVMIWSDGTNVYLPAASLAPNVSTTFTASQAGAMVTMTYGSPLAWDLSKGNNFQVQLTGSPTLSVPTNGTQGQSVMLNVQQDSVGSRSISYAWCYTFSSGTPPLLTTTPYAWDKLGGDVVRFQSAAVAISIGVSATVTWTAHGLTSGDFVQFTTTGALPTGLSANTTYWVTVANANQFFLSTTKANAAAGTYITTSGTQSGTQTCTCININIVPSKDFR